MIDLLYHATIYYEIRKYIQESDPNTLKYEMVIEKAKAHERNCLEYKDHQASHGGANSMCLCTITPCYLLMPLISVGPVAGIKAISVANVANLTSEATVPLMGKLVTNAKVLIISKQCVIQRYKTGQRRALTRRSHSNSPGERLQAAMAKEEASSSSRRRCPRSIHLRSREHTK